MIMINCIVLHRLSKNIRIWYVVLLKMGVSNPRDDRAARNLGVVASVPLSMVIPRVGNAHLQQNTILEIFPCTTPSKNWSAFM